MTPLGWLGHNPQHKQTNKLSFAYPSFISLFPLPWNLFGYFSLSLEDDAKSHTNVYAPLNTTNHILRVNMVYHREDEHDKSNNVWVQKKQRSAWASALSVHKDIRCTLLNLLYPQSAQRRMLSFRGCTDWPVSSPGAHQKIVFLFLSSGTEVGRIRLLSAGNRFFFFFFSGWITNK